MTTKPLGIGIVGAGIIGKLHAHTYRRLPHANLIAVCDLDRERAAAVAKDYGADDVYTDYRDLLGNAKVEAVAVVTPDNAHRDIAIACAQAGKHILVEKPLATKTQDAQDILDAVNSAGVKLMVNFQNRFSPPFVDAKKKIEQGQLGAVRYIYARLSNTTYVPTTMLSWGDKTSPLWFLGSHTVDLTCWLLDAQPKRVFSVSRSGVLHDKGIDTQDLFATIVEFDNDAVAMLENAWILPESEPNVFNLKMELLGDKGSLYVNTSDHRMVEAYTAEGAFLPDMLGVVPTSPLRVGGFMHESIAQFVDAITHEAPSPIPGEDGLANTRILEAIAESARLGKPIDLGPAEPGGTLGSRRQP